MDVVPLVAVTDAVLSDSNVADATALFVIDTTYAEGAVVYEVIDNVHQRFVSQGAGNVGSLPSTDDGSNWLGTGPTNRWAMFDATVATRTTNSETIEVELSIPATERIDVVYLAGLAGETVRIEVEDAIEGPVYDETFSLADLSGIVDWYAYFFDPVVFLEELLVVDLPNGAGSVLTITVANPGDTVECGALVTGFRKNIGDTKWGFRTEIRDYSRVIENDLGDRELFEGNYRKIATGDAIIDNRIKDGIERVLTEGRAQARLYIASQDYTTLTILGTARWAVEMNMPRNRSLCSLQLESVV